ncbi:2-oxoglutarate dehydrogenase complex dihydrolipoyllysine-residue succinyltransferase [Candidatus Riflebacteria bacterium]
MAKNRSESGEKINIILPQPGESITEADIGEWKKSSGDFVETEEPIVEIESDKATFEIVADASGILTILIEEGSVEVGRVIGYITPVEQKDIPATRVEKRVEKKVVPEKTAQVSKDYAKTHPSPAARTLMQTHKVDIDSISPSGRGARILKQDVQKKIQGSSRELQTGKEAKPQPLAKKDAAIPSRSSRREKMSRLRRTIAERMVTAKQEAALLTSFNEIDMTAINHLRKKYKDEFIQKHGVKLGFMSFFTKAACVALLKHPIVNASVEQNEIIYHDFCDIGIAVATPFGLVVPVLKNVETLSFAEIEKQILDFAGRGREKKLTPEDFEGGTFTITNGGVFGSMLSTPIIKAPQSAILGMHNIVERPVAINGEVKIRPIMYLAVTYDHRSIDGADAVRFLVDIKNSLEEPERLLLEL